MIILSAYTTLEDMILHVFRERGNEPPLHFIRGGPSGSIGPCSLCCLNGGPNYLRGPYRIMLGPSDTNYYTAYTTLEVRLLHVYCQK